MLVKAKKITQKEIAKLAGVCQGAVSAVLSGNQRAHTKVSAAVREKILSIAREHNYVPNMQARALRGCKSNLIGVLLNNQISQHLYDILRPLEVEAHNQHNRLILGQFGTDYRENEQVLKDFANLNLDGLIVLFCEFKNAGRLFKTYEPMLPTLVFLDPPPKEISASYVELDHAVGMERLVQSIHDIGCRRIALCLNDSIHYTMVKRLKGYREGLKKNGLHYDETLVLTGIPATQSISALLHEAAGQFLDAHAEAILCSNDLHAIGMLKELNRRGVRVPDDILLAGYDDTKNLCLASTPELTSVRQGYSEIAKKLIRLLKEPAGTAETVLPVPIIRESCDKRFKELNDWLN